MKENKIYGHSIAGDALIIPNDESIKLFIISIEVHLNWHSMALATACAPSPLPLPRNRTRWVLVVDRVEWKSFFIHADKNIELFYCVSPMGLPLLRCLSPTLTSVVIVRDATTAAGVRVPSAIVLHIVFSPPVIGCAMVYVMSPL